MDIDDKIRRDIKIAFWSMIAVLLSPFVIMLVVRNLPPDATRQAALDVLHAPIPPVRGRDGSDALWLLTYDVPVERQAEAAAKLRKYYAAYDRLKIEKRDAEAARLPDPRKQLVEFPKFEGEPGWLCPERGLGCLANVRKDPEAAAAAVQVHAAGMDAVARLADFDGVRWGLPPSLSQVVPSWNSLRRLVRTRHALDFVQGRQQQAVADVCRELAGWRRLGADNDMVIGSMIAAAYAAQDLQLLSEMLAGMSPATRLAVECDAALAATRAQELDLCPAMRREFLSVEALYTQHTAAGLKPGARRFWRAVVDADHGVAVIAPLFAAYCGEAVHKLAAQDRKLSGTELPSRKCHMVEKIGDPVTCWMVSLSSDYAQYQDRRTDFAAQLALMRAVAWVHAHGAGELADFKALPAALRPRRPFVVSADGREISVALYYRRKGDRFALQLRAPPSG